MQCYQRIDFLEKWVFMLEPFTKTSSTLIMGYAFQRYLCVFPSEKWKKFDTTIFSIVYVVTFSIVAYGWNGGVYMLTLSDPSLHGGLGMQLGIFFPYAIGKVGALFILSAHAFLVKQINKRLDTSVAFISEMGQNDKTAQKILNLKKLQNFNTLALILHICHDVPAFLEEFVFILWFSRCLVNVCPLVGNIFLMKLMDYVRFGQLLADPLISLLFIVFHIVFVPSYHRLCRWHRCFGENGV